jgi:Ulp1 family protease
MLEYGEDEDHVKYGTFFQSKALDTYNEDLVTAKIGTNTVTIKDLKSLAPGEWWNDTIIDRTTGLLASI